MDRIYEAYNGTGGFSREFSRKSRERIHWTCSQVWGSKVLDVGCSQGVGTILLGRMGYNVHGLDINPDAIAYAKKELEKEPDGIRRKVRFSCGNFLQFKDDEWPQVDAIVMGEVLEHLVRPTDFVNRAFQLLKSAGRLIVTVPFGINDDPDHRQTFYLTNAYTMLFPYFEIQAVKFLGSWIGFVARRREQKTTEQPQISLNLFRQAEEAFNQIERPLVEASARANTLTRQLAEERKKSAELQVLLKTSGPSTGSRDVVVVEDRVQELSLALEDERKAARAQIEQIAFLKAALQLASNQKADAASETRLLECTREVRELRAAAESDRKEQLDRAERLGQLQGTLTVTQASLRETVAERDRLRQEVMDLDRIRKEADDRARQCDEDRAASQRRAAELEARVAELMTAGAEAAERLRALVDEKSRLQSDASRIAEACTSLEGERDRLLQETKAAEEAWARERQTALDERHALQMRLEAEVADLKARLGKKSKALEAEIAWSVQHRRESEAEYERVLKEADAAQTQLKDATDAQAKLEAAQAKLQRQNEVIQRRLEAKTRAYDKLAAAKLGRLTLAYWRLKDGWRKPRAVGEGK